MKNTFLIFILSSFLLSCHAAEQEMESKNVLKLLKKGENIQITNKIIMGDLNFYEAADPVIVNPSNLETVVNSNIFFVNCVFVGQVNASGMSNNVPVHCRFNNNVVFLDCDFREEVNFDNVIIFGMLNFNKTKFRENCRFNNLTVWSRDSYFSEIRAEKNFMMTFASFQGNFYSLSSEYQGKTSFQGTKIDRDLMMNNSIFSDKTIFETLDIRGGSKFNYSQFLNRSSFSYSNFWGQVDFVNTIFSDSSSFENVNFENNLRTISVTNEENMIFTDCFFKKREL